MDIQQGKKLYSRIQRLARENSATAGSLHQQLPGSMRQAAFQVYTAEASNAGLVFEEWWNEVHGHGTARLNPDGKTKLSHASIQERYLDLAMKETFLPPDELLNKRWGCKNGTLSSIRSRMKDAGFEFQFESGIFEVIKRPAQRPILKKHETSRPTVIMSNPPAIPDLQPVLIERDAADVADAAAARSEPGASVDLDAYLAERAIFKCLYKIIEQQGKIIDLMGPMFGVMKKMAEAWGASA